MLNKISDSDSDSDSENAVAVQIVYYILQYHSMLLKINLKCL